AGYSRRRDRPAQGLLPGPRPQAPGRGHAGLGARPVARPGPGSRAVQSGHARQTAQQPARPTDTAARLQALATGGSQPVVERARALSPYDATESRDSVPAAIPTPRPGAVTGRSNEQRTTSMRATAYNQRLLRGQPPSYERLQARLAEDHQAATCEPVAVHCGWGRLLIGHTYPDATELAQALLGEQPGERDIALYVAAPQQVLAQAPQQLFLDPSDTRRLWFSDYRQAHRSFRGFRIRRAQ